MPKKKSKPKENVQDENNKEPSSVDKKSPEGEFTTYIGVYIDSYMNYVEELNIDEADFPLFYTYYPFEVQGYILPDNSTCILFRGLASTNTIDVKSADYDVVDSEIKEKRFDHICVYPPSHPYTNEEAKNQAKKDVDMDIGNTKQISHLDAERQEKDYTLKSIRMLSVVIPWTGERESSSKERKDGAAKFDLESLKMKKGEDFIDYSGRIKGLESSFFLGEPPPPPVDTPPPEKSIPIDAPSATNIPIPSTGTPTNISIEIKPDTQKKGDIFDERKEMEMLRLKKTLYIQATDIDNLKKKEVEISNKLQNVEQMRQTVFRMNRKVYDSDAKVANLERNNRGLITEIKKMREEQKDENKKMRRFITEKTKKARNQAMIVAAIAIALSLISLPFLIMLLIKFWGEIKSMIGM